MAIVDVVPVDVELAIVGIPVHVRHIAIRVPRTLLPDSIIITGNLLQDFLC